MVRFIVLAVAIAGGSLVAAPIPTDARQLVAKLGDPSAKVRDEATAALRDRPDALPWLRRAARSADADTVRRAVALITPHETKRQTAVVKAIDACIRDGQADLFMEWPHYWQPETKDDLWTVGPRMIQVAREEFGRWARPQMKSVEQILALDEEPGYKRIGYDSPAAEAQRPKGGRGNTLWSIRTDRWPSKADPSLAVGFGSVAGEVQLDGASGGRFFCLGPIQSLGPLRGRLFAVCDGEFHNGYNGYSWLAPTWGNTSGSFIVCRGDFRGTSVLGSVVLVDGDVELFVGGSGGGVPDPEQPHPSEWQCSSPQQRHDC